jgi:glyoxylase-like metal-dependent hydrolase (beta-lactamase superfamily II)
MKQLTKNTYWLTEAVGAHCYWLDDGERVAIIDPGMKGGLNKVARELRAAGRSPYEVTDILLTHYDIDHTGAAAEWQRRTGARTWIGSQDAAILTGAVPPPATFFRQFTGALVHVELPGNVQLIEGDTELWSGLTALHTPGHTPGHHSFRHGSVLFVGDTGTADATGLKPMRNFIMSDPMQGLADLARLGAQGAEWVCCGHSDPVQYRL